MLTIQNLLKNIYCCMKNISKKSYRNCAVIVYGFAIFAMVSLQAQAFGGTGKNKITAADHSTQKMEEENQEESKESGVFAGADFSAVCKSALDLEQSNKEPRYKAEKQQREVVKVYASLEQVKQMPPPEPLNPYGEMAISQEDQEALCRIVEAEAGGEDETGKILVAEVVLNRVLTEGFEDNVYDVIFERSGGSAQFAPTADGRYYSVDVTQETRTAVDKALYGDNISQGALFFSARSKADPGNMAWFDSNLQWLFQYGGHEFYTLP